MSFVLEKRSPENVKFYARQPEIIGSSRIQLCSRYILFGATSCKIFMSNGKPRSRKIFLFSLGCVSRDAKINKSSSRSVFRSHSWMLNENQKFSFCTFSCREGAKVCLSRNHRTPSTHSESNELNEVENFCEFLLLPLCSKFSLSNPRYIAIIAEALRRNFQCELRCSG